MSLWHIVMISEIVQKLSLKGFICIKQKIAVSALWGHDHLLSCSTITQIARDTPIKVVCTNLPMTLQSVPLPQWTILINLRLCCMSFCDPLLMIISFINLSALNGTEERHSTRRGCAGINGKNCVPSCRCPISTVLCFQSTRQITTRDAL